MKSENKTNSIYVMSHTKEDGKIDFLITFPNGVDIDKQVLKGKVQLFSDILKLDNASTEQLSYFTKYLLETK